MANQEQHKPLPIVGINKLPQYNMSPFTNEYEVMWKVQTEFDGRLGSIESLNLQKMGELLDSLEEVMNQIDS